MKINNKVKNNMFDGVLIADKGSAKKFFHMLWKGRLPYLWIAAYIALSVFLVKIGINVTEYSAKMFAGNVSFVGVIIPFLIYTFVNMIIGTISSIVSNICIARISRNLMRTLWKKIVYIPMKYYTQNQPKELLSRITTDTSVIGTLIMNVFIQAITSSYMLYATFAKIGTYNKNLMFSLIAVCPIIILIAFVMGKLNFGINDTVNRKNAELTRNIAEKVDNILLIKSFGTENKEAANGIEKMRDLYHFRVKNNWIRNLGNPIYAVAGALQFIFVIMVGRGFYSNGTLTLAQWVAYFAFSTSVVNTLSSYSGNWVTFKASQGATKRVANIIAEQNESRGTNELAENISGNIEFHNVDFNLGQSYIFKNLNLSIPEGKTTLIIGKSGSGKTSMLNLIDHLYELDNGKITIGDIDINDFNMKSYRENICYVTQESMMFSGTIRENILLGVKHKVTDEEIDYACKEAGAYDFIHKFAEKYDTQVGESGSKLSGGQKQRIAVARVILKKPKYLLMDEGISAMDIKSKVHALEVMKKVMKGKTTVFVSHDIQNVIEADYIIVLEKGNVIDAGTHKELFSRCKYYQQFVNGKEVKL
ncbi:ABC transporter ATP-binding protein [Clostridium hydrogenum]|uniref:ABC transporter ATP-binding protein n=1 Tax=Clostridium hydrogenum TaxID=2855764 RepID=UPI002E303963|nr:ATP-binding cassette domain-containing protein [Clostridium hydrogenum]